MNTNQNQLNLRSGLMLYPSQQDAIESILNDLFNQTAVRFLLLADITGQPISIRGEQNQVNVVAIASLVASDLAASQEIARMTGQYADYQMVLREGQTTNAFIVEVGHHMALLVQTTTETPIGWARLLIKKTAHQLAEIIDTVQEDPIDETSTPQLDQDELSDLFSSALDDIWKE